MFLIGARINRWWLLPFALPILARMRKMQRELLADPSSGLLAIQSLGSADVQYWRSKEDLLRYAEKKTHSDTSKSYFRRIFKNQAFGIWHETYVVPEGHYECIYTNVPRRGLGLFKPLVEPVGHLATAERRLAASQEQA